MERINVWHLFDLCGRKIVFCACFLLLTSGLFAQQNLENHDKKLIHFGMSLGFNQARFAITHSEAFIHHDSIKLVNSPSSPGFNIGIISSLHMSKRFELRFVPTLTFAERDLIYNEVHTFDRDTTIKKTIESIILAFPLSVRYKSDRFFDNFRFYVHGGLRFDWDLGSNSEARRANDIVKIGGTDVVAEYGFGLQFYLPLFIFSPELKISHGLFNNHVPTDGLRFSDVLGKLKSRYFMVSFNFEG